MEQGINVGMTGTLNIVQTYGYCYMAQNTILHLFNTQMLQ